MHISKFYVLSPDASDEGNCAFPAMHLYVSELIFVRTVQMNQLDFCCFTFNRKAFTIKKKTVYPFNSQYTTYFSPLPWNCFFLQTLHSWELSINRQRQITNNLKLASAVLVGIIQQAGHAGSFINNLKKSEWNVCNSTEKKSHPEMYSLEGSSQFFVRSSCITNTHGWGCWKHST